MSWSLSSGAMTAGLVWQLAYVCQLHACQTPTTSVLDLLKQLGGKVTRWGYRASNTCANPKLDAVKNPA
jgi:hypothetical protein